MRIVLSTMVSGLKLTWQFHVILQANYELLDYFCFTDVTTNAGYLIRWHCDSILNFVQLNLVEEGKEQNILIFMDETHTITTIEK